ncbi:hypothetical protein FRX31_028037 [Thalictrum thalictroides]|uniref:RNase H type-1 domain-containing protein n=1 Tax=Thalictrum thalictroides TaxID=46969 RepID=A0A7J6VBB2_THATH|nr:hypothetical protein FRX31_028037 [Thalictrum thalictroides]
MMDTTINFDIAYANPDSEIGIGYIIRTSSGSYVYAGSETGHAGAAEDVDCQGILIALRTGLNHNLSNIILETDCQNATLYLSGKEVNLSWNASCILDNVKILALSFMSVIITFCMS